MFPPLVGEHFVRSCSYPVEEAPRRTTSAGSVFGLSEKNAHLGVDEADVQYPPPALPARSSSLIASVAFHIAAFADAASPGDRQPGENGRHIHDGAAALRDPVGDALARLSGPKRLVSSCSRSWAPPGSSTDAARKIPALSTAC